MEQRAEILLVRVQLTETQEVAGAQGDATLIRFTGDARGPLFQGKILGDGTDTQARWPGRAKTLSARYLMEGTDYVGNSCRLFVENNAELTGDGPLRTTPRILTDSPLLKGLEQAKLTGEIEGVEEGVLRIHIYAEVAWQDEERVILHHGREVYGVLRRPAGAGPFPLVILSHGYGGCYRDFEPLAALLAGYGVASYRFDFCGGSPRAKSGMDTRQMSVLTETEDLCAVVDRLCREETVDAERVFLFGGSQGGFVSALAAEERKEQIRGMMLLYPAFCIPDDWRERYPVGTEAPESLDFWDVTLGSAYVLAAREMDLDKRIGGYQGPVLICHGDQDEIVNLRYARWAEQRYKDAALEVFPGEGHGFSPEADSLLEGRVLAFLRKLGAISE